MFTPFDSPETTVLGGTLVVLGYLLAVHGWTFLVAGFDDSSIPKDVVADQIGRFSLVVGAATIGFGALTTSSSYGFGWQGMVFGLVVLLATVGLTYRLHSHTEPATPEPADQVGDEIAPTTQNEVELSTPADTESGTSVEEPTRVTAELSTTPASPPARTPAERTTKPTLDDPSRADTQRPAEVSN